MSCTTLSKCLQKNGGFANTLAGRCFYHTVCETCS